jgi:hypothetical protein
MFGEIKIAYTPARCPITGILATMGCRCQRCRPDIHQVFSNNATNQIDLGTFLVNSAAAATGPAPYVSPHSTVITG